MRDTFRKLRILYRLLSGTFDGWRKEVWPLNLDDTYCCNGKECGCQGASVGEIYGERKNP